MLILMNHTITFFGGYAELLSTNVVVLFIHFYVVLFTVMHFMAKCSKCIGLLDEHIRETIMDDVSDVSDVSSEEKINDIISEDESVDIVVRYEKLYNIVDLIIANYVPIKKYREKIPTDFMSEHDINVYGTIYEWGSFCQSMNQFELDYFLENLVTYVGCIDGHFKRYLKRHRNEIESDYHHFLLNINNLNKTTLFTPDYDE
jgi:hypothetical protein